MDLLISRRVATITDFVGQYLNATVTGIESAYNSIIGPDSSAVLWAGSDLGNSPLEKEGYFGPGDWVCHLLHHAMIARLPFTGGQQLHSRSH